MDQREGIVRSRKKQSNTMIIRKMEREKDRGLFSSKMEENKLIEYNTVSLKREGEN